MPEPIDLNAERNKRAAPDPEFVKQDDYGRPMFMFLLSYEMDGKGWSTDVWAYDEADAKARVKGMRDSLRLDGQIYASIPA